MISKRTIGFIRELRRRQVFQTLGMYVGGCWILIEGANIVLPAFGAPGWVLRSIIVVAFAIGLPIAAVLAWLYDISGKGITRDLGPTDTVVVPGFGGRKLDFVVIGVLTAALALSIYVNMRAPQAPPPASKPVSVLIADFDNKTGEPIFDGLLEQALNIGIEIAPNVTAFARTTAEDIAKRVELTGAGLSVANARLVAVREGVNIVLAGSIAHGGSSYRLEVAGLDPASGNARFDASASATGREDVLTSVGTLAKSIRKALGDETSTRGKGLAETFTAASIEAASDYTKAQNLQNHGEDAEAVKHYADAVKRDPEFGRAYSGWALSAFNLGKSDEAKQLWAKALMYMGSMTERERLRTLGLYYSAVTKNYPKAIETYQELEEKYPADDSAHNNLAVLRFLTLDFPAALAEGAKVVDLYPNVALYRGNYALYAMYAGDFKAAVAQGRKLLDTEPGYFKAWLPVAMNALANGDIEAARQAYRSMAKTGDQGAATAELGLADTAIFVGEFAKARETLEADVKVDLDAGNQYTAAAKYMTVADSYLAEQKVDAAVQAVNQALGVSDGEPWIVGASLIYLDAGQVDRAQAIADRLVNELQPQSRAYGMMIHGLILSRQEQHVAAIETLTQAVDLADLWLVRFALGKAYLQAGYNAEAFDEFMQCKSRYGEATSLYLDDLPTYRYMAPLLYWLGQAQTKLGMKQEATGNLTKFLELRPNGGQFAEAARDELR
jgi:tetratricopeptide (TPR) repeat protein